jgi:hypothetical protein
MSQTINVDINGKQYTNIPGNQSDGRCFSGAVYISLYGGVADNFQLNDWIRDNIINPIQALDRRSVEVIRWVLSYIQVPDTRELVVQALSYNMQEFLDNCISLYEAIITIERDGILGDNQVERQTIFTTCGEQLVNTEENKDRNIDILRRCIETCITGFFQDPNKTNEYNRLYDIYIAYIQSLNVGPLYEWTEPNYGPAYILSTNRDIQRNITIVRPDGRILLQANNNFPPLYIYYDGFGHYEPLVPIAQGPVAQRPIRPVQKPVAQGPAAQRPAAQRPVAQGPAAQRPAAQRPAAQVSSAQVSSAQLHNKTLLKDLSLNINDVHTTLDLPFVFNEDDKFKNLLLKPINYSCKIIETDEFNVDEDNDEDDDDDESGIFGIVVNKNKKKEKQKTLIQKITGAFKAGGKKNQIISRNVDYIEVNNKKNNFSTIINDCVEKKKYIPPEDTYNLINKYNKLMICCKEEEEDGEDEDIDAMLIKIKESIKNYKGKISKNSQRTFFLTTTIYKNYKNGSTEADFIKAKYDELNVTDFMNKCNTLLKRLEPVDTALEVMECKYKIKNPYDVVKFNTNQLSQIYDDLSKIDKNDANNFVKEIESFNLKQIFKRYTEFVNKGDEKNAKIYLKGLESYCK